MDLEFVKVDLNNSEHQKGLLSLMDDYMQDDMGLKSSLPEELGIRIISGLKSQNNYLGFLIKFNSQFVALANCFVGFSTFKAKQLINIHDFVVSPSFRKMHVGSFLLQSIVSYGKKNDFCKVTLEVRDDNPKAQKLYKQTGFKDCNPPMYFWECVF